MIEIMSSNRSLRNKNSSSRSNNNHAKNAVVSDTESECNPKMDDTTSTSDKQTTGRSTSGRRSRSSLRPSTTDHHNQNHTKHYVEHNYHDHKYDPVHSTLPDLAMTSTEDGSAMRKSGHRGGVSTPFPEKLHELLESVDQQGLNHIIGWQPHGRCFVVHQPKEFVTDVMPQFFKQSKLTSFQRQLNLYAFQRITQGPDRGGYYHELFIRGRSDLSAKMVRTRVKGNGSKAASSPSTEPDFYKMEPCLVGDTPNATLSDNVVDERVLEVDNNEEVAEFGVARMETPEPLDETFPFASASEQYPVTPVSNAATSIWEDSTHGDFSGAILDQILLPFTAPTEAKFVSLPPVAVTPGEATPRLVVSRRVNDDTGLSPLLPMVASLESVPSLEKKREIHSGDQVFFEGFPFHYLELKDIEESLIHRDVHQRKGL